MTAHEQAVTDGYQGTVNGYRYVMVPEYAAGVDEGRDLRKRIRGALANAHGEVTFESIMGFLKRDGVTC